MGRPAIQSFELSPDVTVYECHPDSERQFRHWRLWDKRAAYNIVMSAKTKEEALVEAIEYWAKRYVELNRKYNELQYKVDSFVELVSPKEDECH